MRPKNGPIRSHCGPIAACCVSVYCSVSIVRNLSFVFVQTLADFNNSPDLFRRYLFHVSCG